MSKPTYNANTGATTSSSGFVNYLGTTRETRDTAFSQIQADHPGAIVIDGDDNWFAEERRRPATFYRKLGVEILAYYHSGISGLAKSGIVLTPEQFTVLCEQYEFKYGTQIDTQCKVIKRAA